MSLRNLKYEAEIALRHFKVLKAVKENQPVGIFKLSDILNMPKHRVRYSLRVLEQAGIIEPSQHGAVLSDNAYEKIKKIKEDLQEIKKYIEEIEELSKDI